MSWASVLPMHSAIRWDKQDKLDWITAENSEWEDDKTHNRAIHIAAQNGHEKFTAKLIAAGADVNSKNGTGSTALHMARSYDYAAICDMLIAAGADKDLKNDAGHCAKDGIEGDKPM